MCMFIVLPELDCMLFNLNIAFKCKMTLTAECQHVFLLYVLCFCFVYRFEHFRDATPVSGLTFPHTITDHRLIIMGLG